MVVCLLILVSHPKSLYVRAVAGTPKRMLERLNLELPLLFWCPIQQLPLYAGAVAGTPKRVFERLHLELPCLQRLLIEDASFDGKAVVNMLNLQRKAMQADSRLCIAVS